MTDSQDKVTFYVKNWSSAASGKGQREEIKIENFKIKQDLSEPLLKSWQADEFVFLFDFLR